MLLAVLVVCLVLFVVLPALVGVASSLLSTLVLGLVIGLLARAIAPGKSRRGLLFTCLVGVVGALIGPVVANALGAGLVGRFLLQVTAAVVLVAVLRPTTGHRAVR